jgi:hypothetical protein
MPRRTPPRGGNLPSDEDFDAAIDRVRRELADTASGKSAVREIEIVARQARHSWGAERNNPTAKEKAAARALRKALATFFKAYRRPVFAPVLHARETIERILGYIVPVESDDDPYFVHGSKKYQWRFASTPAKQRKLRCESELWAALSRYGIADRFKSVHAAVMPVCGYPRAKPESAERYLRARRPRTKTAPASAPNVPPPRTSLGDLLEATAAAPKTRKPKRTIVPRVRNNNPLDNKK